MEENEWRKNLIASHEAERGCAQTQVLITALSWELPFKNTHTPDDLRTSHQALPPKGLPPPNSTTLGARPLTHGSLGTSTQILTVFPSQFDTVRFPDVFCMQTCFCSYGPGIPMAHLCFCSPYRCESSGIGLMNECGTRKPCCREKSLTHAPHRANGHVL